VLNDAFLPRLNAWTERRVHIARAYLAGIDNEHVRPLPVPISSQSVWHLFPVLLNDGCREGFRQHLAANEIQSQVHYPMAIPDQRAATAAQSLVVGTLERARNIAARTCSVPIHPFLTDEQVRRTVAVVNSFQPRC
jgi:dTDP-4-amino-4,6-dideoxygalactose transaminase